MTFNGVKIETTSASSLLKLYAPESIPAEFKISVDKKVHGADHPGVKFPWNVAVAVTSGAKFSQVSVVNGVVCSKGHHVVMIKKLVTEAVVERLQKATKDKKKTDRK